MAKKVLLELGGLLLAFGEAAQAQEVRRIIAPANAIPAQIATAEATGSSLSMGPQSPRDLTKHEGRNRRIFASAPERQLLNICNIHLHKNAEHRGGEFTTYAGPGDGHGNGTGFKYDGKLTATELAPMGKLVGKPDHDILAPGDTIEIHFVYSSADTKPGVGLGACFNDAIKNPQLRVEAVVAVLVNNTAAINMAHLAEIRRISGLYQTPNIPEKLGPPVRYAGSTTGPDYNEVASPFQVTWSVRPLVAKLDINSVAAWLADNPFNEDHAHGVRSLVTDPEMLSPID